jgi:hypothetical protein
MNSFHEEKSDRESENANKDTEIELCDQMTLSTFRIDNHNGESLRGKFEQQKEMIDLKLEVCHYEQQRQGIHLY